MNPLMTKKYKENTGVLSVTYSREWWMATDDEIKTVTTHLHIAESMAIDRDDTIALTSEMLCKPLRFTNINNIIEIVRPPMFYYR